MIWKDCWMRRMTISYEDSINPRDVAVRVAKTLELSSQSNMNKKFMYCTQFDDGIIVFHEKTFTGLDKMIVRRVAQ